MWCVMLLITTLTIGCGRHLLTVDQLIDCTLKYNLRFEIARCFRVINWKILRRFRKDHFLSFNFLISTGNALSCKETFSLLFYEFDAATREPPPWQPESYKLIGMSTTQCQWLRYLWMNFQSFSSSNRCWRRSIQSELRCWYKYRSEKYCRNEERGVLRLPRSRCLHQCVGCKSLLHHMSSGYRKFCSFQWNSNWPWNNNYWTADWRLRWECWIKWTTDIFMQRWR